MEPMISINRFKTDESGTFGTLMLNGERLAYTCELPWNNNDVDTSCIPPGTYICVPYTSEEFLNVWEISGVHGRSLILIHNGNTESDTKGCVLIGDKLGYIGDQPAVLNSVTTLARLKTRLPPTFELSIFAIGLNMKYNT